MITLLYRFGPEVDPGIPWGDASFSIHLINKAERGLPPADEERVPLRIFLVDASTGIIRAMRLPLLPTEFTRALHGALRAQAEAPWNEWAFHRAVAQILSSYQSNELARLADHVTTLPPKTSSRDA